MRSFVGIWNVAKAVMVAMQLTVRSTCAMELTVGGTHLGCLAALLRLPCILMGSKCARVGDQQHLNVPYGVTN
jgi:hypothetical protein